MEFGHILWKTSTKTYWISFRGIRRFTLHKTNSGSSVYNTSTICFGKYSWRWSRNSEESQHELICKFLKQFLRRILTPSLYINSWDSSSKTSYKFLLGFYGKKKQIGFSSHDTIWIFIQKVFGKLCQQFERINVKTLNNSNWFLFFFLNSCRKCFWNCSKN